MNETKMKTYDLTKEDRKREQKQQQADILLMLNDINEALHEMQADIALLKLATGVK